MGPGPVAGARPGRLAAPPPPRSRGILTAVLAPALLACLACGPGPADPAPATPTAARPVDGDALAPSPLLAQALLLARRDHPLLEDEAVEARVAALARAWRDRLDGDTPPRERAAALGQVLFEEGGFRSVDDLESFETLHLDSVVERKEGYCLSLSVLALAMAEMVGEPLRGVAAPAHAFVRWDDGETAVDIELTRRGELVEDGVWAERLADTWHEGSFYLRPLTADEVVALLRHNRGFVQLAEGNHERARKELEAVAARVPSLPDVHRTLGILHGESRRYEEAVAAFERALELYPGDVDALLNLALCKDRLGQHAAARGDLETVLLLDPGHPRATKLLAAWSERDLGDARALDDPPPGLRPGLLGTYYRGMRFDDAVTTRVDRGLDFDWKRGRPARRVPDDRFSVRWTGWFKAPRDGHYTLFVVANDGVRVRFGDTLAVDHWETSGYTSWTGSGDVWLPAAYHPLEVEYFDRSDNARLVIIVGVEGQEYPLELEDHLFHEAP